MKYLIEDTTLTAIGDAVRTKGGTSDLIKVSELPNAIINLPSGGGEGGVELPEEAFNITGSCNYMFSNNKWAWFIDMYGNQINTNAISDTNYMFQNSNNLIEIPFDINITNNNVNMAQCFGGCSKLTNAPYIIGGERTPPTGPYSGCLNIGMLFYSCRALREIPYDYFWKMVPNEDFWEAHKIYWSANASIFNYCYSLRELPDISMLGFTGTASYSGLYNSFSQGCYVLNKAINLPVGGTYTSNAFSSFLRDCHRISEIIFATNEDGTPKTAEWKSQTIDLSSRFGYAFNKNLILNYNSGITADKEVYDDATYQALKDDPDWFTIDVNYSRYNHDSAVNTINSLPDTSAYGTNTIKFEGASGALTDGGAINTLTEEEIAVAAAKGWSVALS